MAPLSNHVSLTITQDTLGIARAGFGVPMILSATAAFAERIRFYSSLAEVAVDFAVTTSAEYLAAQAIFSQSPHPEQIAIGRSALPPTQVYTGGVANIRNSHAYTVVVRGKSVTTTTVSITSGGSATNDAIVDALVTALNAVSGNNYVAAVVTGSGDTDTFTVTADAAGGWFSLEVNINDLYVAQTHADPGVATDLAAIALENNNWYCLLTLYNSNAYVVAAAGWVESNKKVYVWDGCDSIFATGANGNSDTLDDLQGSSRARSMGAFHPSPADMMAAAWAGRCLALEPGSETWKFKTLSGVTPVTLTSTQRGNITDKAGNSYETVSGVSITFNGTTADGDFLDVQRGLDWLEDDMGASVYGALAGNNKVPFTDAGVGIIENEVRGSLRRAVAKGILSDDPAPVVTVPLVANVDSDDKALRLLPDVKFSGTLAGAIHKVTITGVVSV